MAKKRARHVAARARPLDCSHASIIIGQCSLVMRFFGSSTFRIASFRGKGAIRFHRSKTKICKRDCCGHVELLSLVCQSWAINADSTGVVKNVRPVWQLQMRQKLSISREG